MNLNFEIQRTTNTPTYSIAFRTGWLVGLSALYAVLFFHFEMGLNVLLYDVVLLLTLLRLRPDLPQHRGFTWSVAGLLFAAGSVVVVNGAASVIAHHVSFLLVLGFTQARELRFIWFGLLLGLMTLGAGPYRWVRQLRQAGGEGAGPPFLTRIAPALAAAVIACPFALFYFAGNEALSDCFNWLLDYAGRQHPVSYVVPFLLLFSFSLLLISGLLYPTERKPNLVERQEAFTDQLTRGRRDFEPLPPQARKGKSLRTEARLATYTLATLNALILLVNVADLKFVWLSPTDLSAATLSHYVHVGTGNLIASICLAIVVVLYFFRGNLNFCPNPQIKSLAIAWIAQNAVLLASVGVRNYHYLDAYGLAIGRVYVVFALLLLAFGLFTLFQKVTKRLSFTYLCQSNGMALWLGLLVFGAVNWAGVITRYNLATQTVEEIDWEYLYHGFDGRNDFLLYNHPKAKAANAIGERLRYPYVYNFTDWRGWNYAQYRLQQSIPDPRVYRVR